MKNKPFYKNKNFLIIAALVVVIAIVLIIALTRKSAPSIAPDAQRIDLAGVEPLQSEAGTDSEAETLPAADDAESAGASEAESPEAAAAEAAPEAQAQTEDVQPSNDTADAPQSHGELPEAAAYVLCSLPGSGQYGILPLPEEGSVSYPIRQRFPDGTEVENVLCLTPDGFCMETSTCANQDCVGQGTVTLDNRGDRVLGNCVICLPNQVMAELYTAEEIAEMDLPASDEASAEATED